jgi:serine protease AprX
MEGRSMNVDRTRPCLQHLRQILGEAFAAKATDDFCQTFVRPAPDTHLADDGFPRRMLVVVELVPHPPQSPAEAVAALRGAPVWRSVRDRASPALTGEMYDEDLRQSIEALLDPSLIRRTIVTAAKERTYRIAAPIRDALSRLATEPPPGVAGPPVQFSWVNETFIAWIDPRNLRELAADPLVHQIDLPRRLELQLGTTGTTVGAVQFRQDFGRSGKGVKVAVIDSEVALLPGVFQNRIVQKENFTAEDWGVPGMHGTGVAGIIAANGAQGMGMAPEAEIYNYKVVMTNLVASPHDFHGACALGQALEDGADVANCSWNTTARTNGRSREARACDTVWAYGMTVVVATGNQGPLAGSAQCPADAKGVISVGATGRDGRAVQGYSGRGPTRNGKLCPDMVAPGGTPQNPIEFFQTDGTFGPGTYGTSFAAPHVSGVLALLIEHYPGLTPDEQSLLLQSLCTPLETGTANDFGNGLLTLDNVPRVSPP